MCTCSSWGVKPGQDVDHGGWTESDGVPSPTGDDVQLVPLGAAPSSPASSAATLIMGLNENMTMIYSKFKKVGCLCVHLVLYNDRFMLPAARSRVWFIYCNVQNLGIPCGPAQQRLDSARGNVGSV